MGSDPLERALACAVVLPVLAVQGGVALYLAFLANLMTKWFADDGWAFAASATDWWISAAARLATWTVVAVCAAGVTWVVNRSASRMLDLENLRLERWSALAVGVVIWMAALIGSVEFLITKPYL